MKKSCKTNIKSKQLRFSNATLASIRFMALTRRTMDQPNSELLVNLFGVLIADQSTMRNHINDVNIDRKDTGFNQERWAHSHTRLLPFSRASGNKCCTDCNILMVHTLR